MRKVLLFFTLLFCVILNAQLMNNDYYEVTTEVINDKSIDKVIISGPPTPPSGFEKQSTRSVGKPTSPDAVVTIGSVPAYDWCHGCSATSAAMIAAYWDNNGFPNMYTGPAGKVSVAMSPMAPGEAPMVNDTWWATGVCPISATIQGYDGLGVRGHVDDYYISYQSPLPDPYIGNWAQHTWGDCTGDYMKTNQSAFGNDDGSTTFYNYTSGAKLTSTDMEGFGIHNNDGGYGLKLFYEARGYTIGSEGMYNQYILGYDNTTDDPDLGPTSVGFTFAEFKQLIDWGRPILIHVEGHTMVGMGYNDTGGAEIVYLRDTWDCDTSPTAHSMTWGGLYGGMLHSGVTVVHLDGALPVTLSTFTANVDKYSIVLDWVTESEVENLGFILEKRHDSSEWITIASYKSHPELKGQGTTSEQTGYQFIDYSAVSGKTYEYRLSDVDFNGNVTNLATRIITMYYPQDDIAIIKQFRLLNAFPNPFNAEINIQYEILDNTNVQIELFDINGNLVNILTNEEKNIGWHTVKWDGKDSSDNQAPGGVYICRISTSREIESFKLMYLK